MEHVPIISHIKNIWILIPFIKRSGKHLPQLTRSHLSPKLMGTLKKKVTIEPAPIYSHFDGTFCPVRSCN